MRGSQSSVKDKSKSSDKSLAEELNGQTTMVQNSKQDVEKELWKTLNQIQILEIMLIGRKKRSLKTKKFSKKSQTYKQLTFPNHSQNCFFQKNHQMLFTMIFKHVLKIKVKITKRKIVLDKSQSYDVVKGIKIIF